MKTDNTVNFPIQLNWKKICLIILGLDILVFLIIQIFKNNHSLTEKIYFKGLYPVISAIVSFISNIFLFSIQEIIIFLIILSIIFFFFFFLYLIIKKKISLKNAAIKFSMMFFLIFSILYIFFYLNWGFNYFRTGLMERKSFNKRLITQQNLKNLLLNSIKKVNKLYPYLKKYNIKDMNNSLEKNISKVVMKLDSQNVYSTPKIKYFISRILTILPVSGVSLPLFHEAHIAKDLFVSEIPFIAAHEKAHLKGYAGEAEANYIAYLTCIRSKLEYVRFSGYFSIIKYLYYSLNKNEKKYFRKLISSSVLNEFKKIRKRHSKKNKFIAKFQRKIYNTYLKANQVKGGTKNYSYVTKLILGYRLN